MDKLYVLTNERGRIITDFAYRTIGSAKRLEYEFNCNGFYNVGIEEVEVEFAKRSVCYLQLYKGYDYGTNSIYDVDNQSKIFSCSNEARKHRWWIDAEKIYEADPENHYMDDELICSYDGFLDEKFCYGDVMEGKFRLSIERLKVRR